MSGTPRIAAKLFGLFFICSFLSYAVGNSFLEAAQNEPVLHQNFLRLKLQISIGFILVAVVHTLFNIGLLACMLVLLKPVYPVHRYVYFSCGIISTVLLAAGAACLALPLSAGGQYIQTNKTIDASFTLLVQLTANCKFYLYQSGMAVWGVGGLTLCYILYKTKAVPSAFPLSGVAGYMVFIAGTLLELLGYPYGLSLSIPGGLFEIGLSSWLILKSIRIQPLLPVTDQ